MRPDEAAGPSPGVSFLPRAPLPPTPRATPISAAATAAKLARRKTDTVDLHSDQNSGPGPPQEVDGTAAWLANQTPQHRGRTYRANGELPTPLESANDILHERSTELDGSPLTRKYLTSLRRLADVERNLDASEDHVGQVTRELQALKSELSKKRKETSELIAARDALQNRTNDLEKMVAELQAVNESVGQQLVLSRAQLKIANEQLASSDLDSQQSRTELDRAREQLSTLERSNQAAKEQIDELSLLFKELQEDRDQKDAVIAELTSEVERLNAEVQLLRRSTSPVDPEQSLPEETTPDLRLALSEHILLPPPQIFAEQSTQTPETPSNPQPVAMVDAEASTYEQQAIPVDQSSQAYPSMAEIGTSCSPSQLDLGALTDRTYDWTGSPILSSVSPIETSGLTRDISTESLDTAASPWSIDSGDILQDYSSMEPEPSGFDDPFSFGEQVEDSIDDGAVAAIMFPGGKTYFVAKDERQVAAARYSAAAKSEGLSLEALALLAVFCVIISFACIYAVSHSVDEGLVGHGHLGISGLSVAAQRIVSAISWLESG